MEGMFLNLVMRFFISFGTRYALPRLGGENGKI